MPITKIPQLAQTTSWHPPQPQQNADQSPTISASQSQAQPKSEKSPTGVFSQLKSTGLLRKQMDKDAGFVSNTSYRPAAELSFKPSAAAVSPASIRPSTPRRRSIEDVNFVSELLRTFSPTTAANGSSISSNSSATVTVEPAKSEKLNSTTSIKRSGDAAGKKVTENVSAALPPPPPPPPQLIASGPSYNIVTGLRQIVPISHSSHAVSAAQSQNSKQWSATEKPKSSKKYLTQSRKRASSLQHTAAKPGSIVKSTFAKNGSLESLKSIADGEDAQSTGKGVMADSLFSHPLFQQLRDRQQSDAAKRTSVGLHKNTDINGGAILKSQIISNNDNVNGAKTSESPSGSKQSIHSTFAAAYASISAKSGAGIQHLASLSGGSSASSLSSLRSSSHQNIPSAFATMPPEKAVERVAGVKPIGFTAQPQIQPQVVKQSKTIDAPATVLAVDAKGTGQKPSIISNTKPNEPPAATPLTTGKSIVATFIKKFGRSPSPSPAAKAAAKSEKVQQSPPQQRKASITEYGVAETVVRQRTAEFHQISSPNSPLPISLKPGAEIPVIDNGGFKVSPSILKRQQSLRSGGVAAEKTNETASKGERYGTVQQHQPFDQPSQLQKLLFVGKSERAEDIIPKNVVGSMVRRMSAVSTDSTSATIGTPQPGAAPPKLHTTPAPPRTSTAAVKPPQPYFSAPTNLFTQATPLPESLDTAIHGLTAAETLSGPKLSVVDKDSRIQAGNGIANHSAQIALSGFFVRVAAVEEREIPRNGPKDLLAEFFTPHSRQMTSKDNLAASNQTACHPSSASPLIVCGAADSDCNDSDNGYHDDDDDDDDYRKDANGKRENGVNKAVEDDYDDRSSLESSRHTGSSYSLQALGDEGMSAAKQALDFYHNSSLSSTGLAEKQEADYYGAVLVTRQRINPRSLLVAASRDFNPPPSEGDKMLKFHEGDILLITESSEEDLWVARHERSGKSGLIHRDYVQKIDSFFADVVASVEAGLNEVREVRERRQSGLPVLEDEGGIKRTLSPNNDNELERGAKLLSAKSRRKYLQDLAKNSQFNLSVESDMTARSNRNAARVPNAVANGGWVKRVGEQVASTIDAAEKQRQQAIFELIDTEQSFRDDMTIIYDEYVCRLRSQGLLSEQEIEDIFANISEIIQISSELANQLSRRQQSNNGVVERIGDLLLNQFPRLRQYAPFCANISYALHLLSERKSQSQELSDALSAIAKHPYFGNMDLGSYLLKPMQRITKLPLLIKGILKHTSAEDDDYRSLVEAESQSQQILLYVNTVCGQMEERRRLDMALQKLQQSLNPAEFGGLDFFNHPGHQRIIAGSNAVLAGSPDKQLSCFLFTDFLLICSAKSLGGSREKISLYRPPIYLWLLQAQSKDEPQLAASNVRDYPGNWTDSHGKSRDLEGKTAIITDHLTHQSLELVFNNVREKITFLNRIQSAFKELSDRFAVVKLVPRKVIDSSPLDGSAAVRPTHQLSGKNCSQISSYVIFGVESGIYAVDLDNPTSALQSLPNFTARVSELQIDSVLKYLVLSEGKQQNLEAYSLENIELILESMFNKNSSTHSKPGVKILKLHGSAGSVAFHSGILNGQAHILTAINRTTLILYQFSPIGKLFKRISEYAINADSPCRSIQFLQGYLICLAIGGKFYTLKSSSSSNALNDIAEINVTVTKYKENHTRQALMCLPMCGGENAMFCFDDIGVFAKVSLGGFKAIQCVTWKCGKAIEFTMLNNNLLAAYHKDFVEFWLADGSGIEMRQIIHLTSAVPIHNQLLEDNSVGVAPLVCTICLSGTGPVTTGQQSIFNNDITHQQRQLIELQIIHDKE